MKQLLFAATAGSHRRADLNDKNMKPISRIITPEEPTDEIAC